MRCAPPGSASLLKTNSSEWFSDTMGGTKHTNVKSSTGAKKTPPRTFDLQRPNETSHSIKKDVVKRILPRLKSYRKFLDFAQKDFDLFVPYNDALTLAIRRDLGDVKESEIPRDVINKKTAQDISLRLLNEYLKPYQDEDHPVEVLLEIAIENVSSALHETFTKAFRDLNKGKDEMILKSPALLAIARPEQWRNRFAKYHNLSETDRSHVKLDGKGGIYTKYAYECVFYGVFKWYTLEFPVPKRTTVSLKHKDKSINVECTLWSNRSTETIVFDKNAIDIPEE